MDPKATLAAALTGAAVNRFAYNEWIKKGGFAAVVKVAVTTTSSPMAWAFNASTFTPARSAPEQSNAQRHERATQVNGPPLRVCRLRYPGEAGEGCRRQASSPRPVSGETTSGGLVRAKQDCSTGQDHVKPQENCQGIGAHVAAPVDLIRLGKRTSTRVPAPGSDSIDISPPWPVTISREMWRPRPVT